MGHAAPSVHAIPGVRVNPARRWVDVRRTETPMPTPTKAQVPDAHPNPHPLVSDYSADPDMAELITLFATELPGRLDVIAQACRERDLVTAARIAHQLRGASAGYGFPAIGIVAGRVEDGLRAAHPDPASALDSVRSTLDELAALCRRVVPGPA